MMKRTAQSLLTAATLAALAGWADAAPLIEESFVYDTGSIAGGSGGTGFTGNWSTNNTAPPVVSPGLSWGSLSVAGNSISGGTGSAARDIGATSVLDTADLMGNGKTLWFSAIVGIPATGNNNVNFNFSLGTDGFHEYVAGSGGTFGEKQNLESGEGIGFGFDNRNDTQKDITGVFWQDNDADDNAERNAIDAKQRWSGPTGLIVGRIDWGATNLAAEKLTLYLPGTDLTLGTAILTDWETAALDQSAFDTVAFQMAGGSRVDEIRFGATSADVLPVPEPGSLALLGLGGLCVLRRRRG